MTDVAEGMAAVLMRSSIFTVAAIPTDTNHNSVGRAPRGRRLGVQKRRQLGPGSAVLCRTAAFRAVARERESQQRTQFAPANMI